MVKAIVVTCPHCNARLPVATNATQVKCEYCGTQAHVQRRTGIFERPMPPPPSMGINPNVMFAVQRPSKVLLNIIVLAAVLPIAIGLVVCVVVAKTTTGGLFGGATEWQGTGSMVFADIDGDGTKEVLGRSRGFSPDAIRVIALDAKTGKVRWQSEPLGTYGDTYQGPLAIAKDLVLFGAPDSGEVRAFGLADGKLRWKATLDERVKHFCDGGPTTVIALGNDDRERPLQRATGNAASPAAKAQEAAPPKTPPPQTDQKVCPALPSDVIDRAADWNRGLEFEVRDKLDVSSEKVYDGASGKVIAATRKTGSRVPVLVAIDGAQQQRWRAVVPIKPLGAPEQAPEPVVVGDREVCAAYYAKSITDDAMQIACFAASDGKRLWDQTGPVDSSLRALEIQGRTLFVGSNGHLQARALDTGAVIWTYGGR